MDIADKASEVEQNHRDRAIRDAKRKANKKGARFCVDCDKQIPAARRAAYPAATRCIECQEHQEQVWGCR